MTKTYNVLILRNNNNIQAEDDLLKTAQYEAKTLGIDLKYTVQDVDLPLKWKSFAVYKMFDGVEQELYGLDGIKDQVRKVVSPGKYHAVFFLYDFTKTNFSLLHPGKQMGNFTYFDELYPGTQFTEVYTSPAGDFSDDLYRIFTHEIRHQYVHRLRKQGIPVIDVMDCTPNTQGTCTPYHKEYEIDALDGNRAAQNAILTPYVDRIVSFNQSALIATILAQIEAIKKQIAALQKSEKKSSIEIMAEGMKIHEGWKVGSCSYRNNNPGNLRDSPFKIGYGICGTSGRFALFKDYATGWKALIHQVTIVAKGTSPVYKAEARKRFNLNSSADLTIAQFFQIYAPSSDNNNPDAYAKEVAKYMGVSINTQLKNLI